MTSKALARRTLPFDAGLSRGLAIYARRAMIIASVTCIVLSVALVYSLYRALTHDLPGWPQFLAVLAVSYAIFAIVRWRVYRDLPTGADQVIALVLFVLCSPVYVFGAAYRAVRPDTFRNVDVVGLKGRLVRAVEYRPTAGDPEVGAYAPDAFSFISLLPSMIIGRVRFRGRPLLRLPAFTCAGPIPLRELGRAPGIFPAHTSGPATPDPYAIPMYVHLWQDLPDPPRDPGQAMLVIYRATVDAGAVRRGRARILLPFVVPPESELELRDRVRAFYDLDDLLLGRADHGEALLRAAWFAWGTDRGPQDESPRRPSRRPRSPAEGRRADA